jgi:hypothetical protein
VSDCAVIVCALDATASDAPARAAMARAWLLERGVVLPNPAPGDGPQPSEFLAGPRAIEIASGFYDESNRSMANNGVDVLCARAVHHPVANYELPRCPACDVPAEDAADLFPDWLEGGEPTVTCAACGKAHPLGDWPGRFNGYVAEIAVRFNNWYGLSDAFLAELGTLLGARWRVVHEHL